MEQVTINDGIKGKFIPAALLGPNPNKATYEHLTRIIQSSTSPERYILAVGNGKIHGVVLMTQDACVLPISGLANLVADRAVIDDKTAREVMAALSERFS